MMNDSRGGWFVYPGDTHTHFFFPWRQVSACGSLIPTEQMEEGAITMGTYVTACDECERRRASGAYCPLQR